MTIQEEARLLACSVLDNWSESNKREPLKKDFEEMASIGVDCLIDRHTMDEVIELARKILLESIQH